MPETADRVQTVARLMIIRDMLRTSYADVDDLGWLEIYNLLVRATDAVNQAVDKLKEGN